MSFVVTNGRIYREFDSILEATSFISQSRDAGLEIYERDLFGNLLKLGNLEIEQLMTEEKTLHPTQTAQSLNPQETEIQDKNSNTNQNQNIKPANPIENNEANPTEAPLRESAEKNKTNQGNGQVVTIKVKYDDKKEKEESPFVKALKIFILILIFGFLAYMIIFIIWPMLKDVIATMNSPPTIGI